MGLCKCGCGEEVGKASYARGHHWKVARARAALPEIKVCEHCGQMYSRASVGQNHDHWRKRKYCTEKCRREAIRVDPTVPRVCTGCGEEKSPEGFYGLRSRCRDCMNRERRERVTPEQNLRYNLKSFYGITPEEYTEMLEAQGGVCAICGEAESAIDYRTKKPYRLSVDHCHETKRVRGLLCGNCNKGIGGLKHDPERLKAAMDYLERTA